MNQARSRRRISVRVGGATGRIVSLRVFIDRVWFWRRRTVAPPTTANHEAAPAVLRDPMRGALAIAFGRNAVDDSCPEVVDDVADLAYEARMSGIGADLKFTPRNHSPRLAGKSICVQR